MLKMPTSLRQIAFLWVSCWFHGEFMPLGLKEDVGQYIFLSLRLSWVFMTSLSLEDILRYLRG